MVKNLFLLIIAFIALVAVIAFQFFITGFFVIFTLKLFTGNMIYLEWYKMIMVGGILHLYFWFIDLGRGRYHGKKPKE